MNVIIVIGEPGTGKTTLMKQLMSSIGNWDQHFSDYPLVPYHQNAKTIVLGKYEDDKVFAGTDTMSMAVQPNAKEFMLQCQKNGIQNVVFEGDRLSNLSFLQFCIENFNVHVYYLKVSKEIREERYKARGSNQSEKFIAGRVTKYRNLVNSFDVMSVLSECQHETPEQTEQIIQEILKIVH